MYNSNLPEDDQNRSPENKEFDEIFEVPKERIFVYTAEPVDLKITISSSCINTVNPKKTALKLFSNLKASLDSETWDYFLEEIMRDPEFLGRLMRGSK